MYCEECFDDMEKNGFAKSVVTRRRTHRTRMLCPMCLDDKVPEEKDLKEFSSTSSTDEYYLKALNEELKLEEHLSKCHANEWTCRQG